jgi:hypothetical protein
MYNNDRFETLAMIEGFLFGTPSLKFNNILICCWCSFKLMDEVVWIMWINEREAELLPWGSIGQQTSRI